MLETLYDNILNEWHEILPDPELDDETVLEIVNNVRNKMTVKQNDEWSFASLASIVVDAKGDETGILNFINNYQVPA